MDYIYSSPRFPFPQVTTTNRYWAQDSLQLEVELKFYPTCWPNLSFSLYLHCVSHSQVMANE
jgi:hypothetical protein